MLSGIGAAGIFVYREGGAENSKVDSSKCANNAGRTGTIGTTGTTIRKFQGAQLT